MASQVNIEDKIWMVHKNFRKNSVLVDWNNCFSNLLKRSLILLGDNRCVIQLVHASQSLRTVLEPFA